jgi:hypothetical protein
VFFKESKQFRRVGQDIAFTLLETARRSQNKSASTIIIDETSTTCSFQTDVSEKYADSNPSWRLAERRSSKIAKTARVSSKDSQGVKARKNLVDWLQNSHLGHAKLTQA